MTTTRDRVATPSDTPPRLRRRRSSRLVLLAVILAVLGALAGAYAFTAATGRVGVVALARTLPVGATVSPADVREVQLPDDTGLATVPWDERDAVIGRVTVASVQAGQIVTPASVTIARVPAPGEAVVGLSVEPGRTPTADLAPGDDVVVITGPGQPTRRASVVSASGPDVSGRRGIDVLVQQTDAADLALASSEDRVVVVLIGRG